MTYYDIIYCAIPVKLILDTDRGRGIQNLWEPSRIPAGVYPGEDRGRNDNPKNGFEQGVYPTTSGHTPLFLLF